MFHTCYILKGHIFLPHIADLFLQNSHQQVESTLAELQEEKSRLAYDKGRLSSRVEQLQKQLDAAAAGQLESVSCKKLAVALQEKLQQVNILQDNQTELLVIR